MHRQSFPHRDFENPEAETCWLSCLFQSLWHSAVFHAAFEARLAYPKCVPGPEERLLAALQRTWADYKREEDDDEAEGVAAPSAEAEEEPSPPGEVAAVAAADPGSMPALAAAPPATQPEGDAAAVAAAAAGSADRERLVPAQGLVDGFGEGYGDMSEALASIQGELSESPNPAVAEIAELMVLVPVCGVNGSWPTPAAAWAQAEEWQVSTAPLIYVDLSLPPSSSPVAREDARELARLWVPVGGGGGGGGARAGDVAGDAVAGGAQATDLGPGHRLVALVCFMWGLRHYVAFCRRQREPARCLLFNDLPALTQGAPREAAWAEVPELCFRHALTPRLALYESPAAAAAEGFACGHSSAD